MPDIYTPIDKTSSSLSNKYLEDADDATLSKADKLYLHLWTNQIEGMGHTNISKLLALSLTNLCVMWDSGVRKDFLHNFPRAPKMAARYGQAHSDYYRFLVQRREVANDLVKQVIAERVVARDKAIAWLRQLPLQVGSDKREKPLAKLIDEYYYWIGPAG